MALQAGTSLGPYRIDAPLGAGGMGEVYKANDTRLGRTVAIKVLPAELAADPERRERFEREAKTISSLQHAHICTLYDVGHQDGIDFLVMEHLEGETLQDRLTKGALPLDQALRYAIEIADALDKAHRQGIVHRDLKPGNIMLTKAGAKLLDFGLAKLRGPAEAAGGLSALPTQEANLTAEGSIVGTFHYMAPEQLEGKTVDTRTDIFAFGVTVYEMATGQKAFGGDSHASLIAAILERDPPPMSALQPMTPPALERVARKCLAKDPEDRWQSARDLTTELQEIVEGGSQSSASLAPPRPPTWYLPVGMAVTVSLVAAVTAGLSVWGVMRQNPEPLARFVISEGGADPFYVSSEMRDLAISPDGQFLVYATGTRRALQLQVRGVDELVPTTLVSEGQPLNPFFSPDGESLGFFDLTGGALKKVSIRGGPTLEIGRTFGRIHGATWGSDDTIVFGAWRPDGLWRVPAAGGEPELLTTPDELGDHVWPEMLPNSQAVVFAITPRDEPANAQLAVLSLADRQITRLNLRGTRPRYVSSGHLVYGVDGTLQAVSFDPDRVEVTGEPIPVVDDVTTKASGAVNFSISDNGTLFYTRAAGQRALVWVHRDGREEPLGHPPAMYGLPRVSPDGSRVAFQENGDIWVLNISPPRRTKITFDPAADSVPLWTPDGERVVFRSRRAEQPGLYWKLADGSDAPELLLATSEDVSLYPYTWSPDGKALVFWQLQIGVGSDIGLLSMEGEPHVEPLLATEFRENAPAISPDGLWLAYTSWETGTAQVYVQRFPDLGNRVLISTDGGQEPVWSFEGRELFYRGPQGMMAVPVETESTFSAREPELLFGERYYQLEQSRTYDLAPDGRFLMVKLLAPQLLIELNWLDELQRLVPSP